MKILFSPMGTYNWLDINFYSHSINEKNTSSLGKAVEMINSFTRSYNFKRSTSDNHVDLLFYLYPNKNNFGWTEVVGDIWSKIRYEYQIITDESNHNLLLSIIKSFMTYEHIWVGHIILSEEKKGFLFSIPGSDIRMSIQKI